MKKLLLFTLLHCFLLKADAQVILPMPDMNEIRTFLKWETATQYEAFYINGGKLLSKHPLMIIPFDIRGTYAFDKKMLNIGGLGKLFDTAEIKFLLLQLDYIDIYFKGKLDTLNYSMIDTSLRLVDYLELPAKEIMEHSKNEISIPLFSRDRQFVIVFKHYSDLRTNSRDDEYGGKCLFVYKKIDSNWTLFKKVDCVVY